MKRTGMIIVSGVPRSGTSLCMDIQREAHGIEHIIGTKFMSDLSEDVVIPKHIKAINEYISKGREDIKDMNPKGFWECPFTVRGVQYSFRMADVLKDVRDGNKRICKVVCSGLLQSDPIYIERIIFTLRHPRDVAKSQERLKHKFSHENELKMHTPQMFISNIVQASRFFIKNPDIPVMFYEFDDLIDNPTPILRQMEEFVGEGDYATAIKVITPNLRRSKDHDHVKSELFDDAEHVYELFKQGRYKDIIEYMSDKKRATNKENFNWPCMRVGTNVNRNICVMCNTHDATRKNLKASAIKRGIDWNKEPCFFECGMDVERDDYISIEESINKNFWNDESIPSLYNIEKQIGVLQRLIDDHAKPCEIKQQKEWVDRLKKGETFNG